MDSAAGRQGRGLVARPGVLGAELAAEEAVGEFCHLGDRGGETITAPGAQQHVHAAGEEVQRYGRMGCVR